MKKYILFLVLVSNTSFAEIACDYSSFKHPDKEEDSGYFLEELNACKLGVNFMKSFGVESAMEECKKIYSLSGIDKYYTDVDILATFFYENNQDLSLISSLYLVNRSIFEKNLNACLIGVTNQALLDKK